MDYNQAADALDRECVTIEAKVFARDAFRALGSLEGATQDAISRREAAVAAAEKAKADLEAITTKVADANKQAADRLAEADKTAHDTMTKADNDAIELVRTANTRAGEIIAAANAKSDALIAKTSADLQAKTAQSAALDIDINVKTGGLKAIEAKTESAQNDLDAVNAMIAKLAGR